MNTINHKRSIDNELRKKVKSLAIKILRMRIYLIRKNKGVGDNQFRVKCEIKLDKFSNRFSFEAFEKDFNFLLKACPSNKKSWKQQLFTFKQEL
jgi:hypothetical protein